MADGVSPVVDTNLGPPPAPASNPIGAAGGIVGVMSDLAEMRNRQNANVLFQQQMSARHQLGQDLTVWASQGLSPEEQIARASHQPYAPFVTPELGNMRQSELAGVGITQTQAQIAEIQSRIAGTGLEHLIKFLAATGGDRDKLDGAFKAAIASAAPGTQDYIKKAYPAVKTALMANLPDEPTAAKAQILQNTRNLGAAFGLPLAKLYAMTNSIAPTLTEATGPQGQVSKVITSGGGNAPINANVLATGPTTAQQEAMKISGQQQAGLPPTVLKMPGGGDSVISGQPAQSSPLIAVPPPAATPGPKALDGSPLFAPDAALPPQFKTNASGTKAYQSPLDESNANAAAKQWQDDQPTYRQIAQTNATIGSMLAESNHAAKTSEFLTSGFAGETRTTMAKIINLGNEWMHPDAKPLVDPNVIAGNESMEKQARQTAFNLIGQLGGGERGLGVLQTALDSVPSLSKTPLGNIVVGESIQAMGKWRLEEQAYKRNWAARTGGDLTGADAQYLKDHSPDAPLLAVLAKHGIDPGSISTEKPAAASSASPPPAAQDHLRQHPELRLEFDQKFGPGAAAKVLGNG